MSQSRLTLKNHAAELRLFVVRNIGLSIAAVVLMLLLITRLFFLQVVLYHRYSTLSANNQMTLIPLPPNRGLIYDRHGAILAKNVPVFNLEITPEHIKDINGVIERLRQLMPISDDEINSFKRQRKQHHSYEPVTLKFKLTDREVANFAVNQYQFPGVAVNARLMRYYPDKDLFAHVLGFVGRINIEELRQLNANDYASTLFIGKVGIEKFYENELHGKVGYEMQETDASGRVVRTMKHLPPEPGKDLYLTIDRRLQLAADQAFATNRGALVAIDPTNGEILAMVSKPSFDPSNFVNGISHADYEALANSRDQPLYNRAIRGRYPLASTIKPFMGLTALDNGYVTRSWSIPDPGWFQLPNSSHIYKDWKKGGHGRVNVSLAITMSCDTYFYTIAKMMGIKHIAKALKQFGFGQYTHIDMGEELPGLVPTPQWKMATKGLPWFPGDTVISGIGQGFLLTTPLQLAQAVMVMSVKGQFPQVHLLQKYADVNGITQDNTPTAHPAVELNHDDVWDHIHDAMANVIRKGYGTGYRFGRDAKYSVAAKTGTAQVYTAKHYEKGEFIPEYYRDHSLFIAFAPVEDPKIAVAVIVENSTEAAHIARQLMDAYLLPPAPVENAGEEKSNDSPSEENAE